MNEPKQFKPYALDQSQEQWACWLKAKGAKPFHAQQLLEWQLVHGVMDPAQFTTLSLALRELLVAEFDWSLPKIDCNLKSVDGSEKLLLLLRDGRLTECVLMPSEKRITLCVSSQVGCRMACTFCQTGRMGFSRQLSAGEILAQIVLANQRLKENGVEQRVSNVVFMGMGEPLDNYDHVVAACRLMIDPRYLGLSKNRVTVSTSGLVPEIRRLGQDVPVSLAISLHAADDAHRSRLMPINRRYPLSELKQALLEYPIQTRHGITFEYVLIRDENDSQLHAKQLVKFLHGLKAKVNLIPMNPHPGNPMEASDAERIRAFQLYLSERGIPAPVRYSRGQDVSAACGQLAAKRRAELEMAPRLVALAHRKEGRL